MGVIRIHGVAADLQLAYLLRAATGLVALAGAHPGVQPVLPAVVVAVLASFGLDFVSPAVDDLHVSAGADRQPQLICGS